MYRVETTSEFDEDLGCLDRAIAQRIIRKIEWLAEHPGILRAPLRHLPENLKGLHKYRVGDYRVLLWVDHEAKVLTLYGVRHRREIYDLLR
ncbi:MAG: type II toxin-antitoxin system RelE/ParE family toxin [Chloroflexi bacterium]|nr:type II toxin-antitoxin system RelE/ParE family toxin [Chloroflexota bacterium]MBU1748906.1 type II toxin-antitoxin system RelE/ParE family toxin [Chloroflexota bacterium]